MHTWNVRGLSLSLGLWLASGAHAQSQQCATDADCPMGFSCEVTGGSSSVDCDGAECQEIVTETFTECVPQPIECEVDADCPAGLACSDQHDSCSIDSQGNESCQSGLRLCSYDLTECETNDDCTLASYTCQDLGGADTCTLVELPCQPGSDCSVPNLVEECTPAEQPQKMCFPRRIDCSNDAACPTEWRCVELSADAQDDAPGAWAGASRVCMPEGVALAIEGALEVGDSDVDGSNGGSSGVDRDDEAAAGDYGPSEGASASGCTVSGGRTTANGVWLLGAAFVLGARRTRRTRPRELR